MNGVVSLCSPLRPFTSMYRFNSSGLIEVAPDIARNVLQFLDNVHATAGQLLLYKQMPERSTGQHVVGLLLHYVDQGGWWKCWFNNNDSNNLLQ